MPTIPDSQIAAYARTAGFEGADLVTMVAIALGESSGRTAVLGDEDLTTSKWGPSIGLTQVRCLWADRGTGRSRDCDRLADPKFNLRSAYEISSGGDNFRPWSVFTSGKYRAFLGRAWKAVAGAGGGGGGALPSGIEPDIGPRGLVGDIPGGGVLEDVAEPLLAGARRIVLVGILLAGGVALVAAGGWRTVQPHVTGKVAETREQLAL